MSLTHRPAGLTPSDRLRMVNDVQGLDGVMAARDAGQGRDKGDG
ncbi:hypothetical protein ACU8V3_09925 [Cobetia marina]